jgi:tetratricopeptide (TPR) repeat protein
MKAEHRHELKTNDLAEWLANLPQWARQNLRNVIHVSIVVVVVVGAFVWHWYNKNIETTRRHAEITDMMELLSNVEPQIVRASAQGADESFRLIQIADNLKTMAAKVSNDRAAALALIKRGQALRSELLYRSGIPDEQEVENQIETARASYEEALARVPGDPSLAGLARIGLGLCAEELGEFDRAADIYRQITADPSMEGTVAVAEAAFRLATMHEYRTPVTIAEAPPEEPAEQAPDGQETGQDHQTPAAAGEGGELQASTEGPAVPPEPLPEAEGEPPAQQ